MTTRVPLPDPSDVALGVAALIKKNPDLYDQSRWGMALYDTGMVTYDRFKNTAAECGTPQCIAGWTVTWAIENLSREQVAAVLEELHYDFEPAHVRAMAAVLLGDGPAPGVGGDWAYWAFVNLGESMEAEEAVTLLEEVADDGWEEALQALAARENAPGTERKPNDER